MLRRLWVLGGALAFSANVFGGGIYKCVSGENIAYQSAPCAPGSAETVFAAMTTAEASARSRHAVDDSMMRGGPPNQVADPATGLSTASAAPQISTGRAVLGADKLSLGITDDQALNTPGWGPPKRIVRNRERAGWREVWTYARRPGGVPQLEFFNGRLVAVSVQPEPEDTARMVTLSER